MRGGLLKNLFKRKGRSRLNPDFGEFIDIWNGWHLVECHLYLRELLGAYAISKRIPGIEWILVGVFFSWKSSGLVLGKRKIAIGI